MSKKDPHFCPLCDTGPANKLKLQTLESRSLDQPDLLESLQLLKELRELEMKVQKYEKHLKQLGIQRNFVKSIEVECMTDHTKGVLYRDFISWYGPDGSKIRVLVFVLLRKGVPMYLFNVNWGKEAGNDTNFWRDGIEHLARNTSILDDLETLYISGDHGPHFSSRRCFYYESTLFESTKS